MSHTSDTHRGSTAPATDDTEVEAGDSEPLLFVHLSDLHFSSLPRDSSWNLDQMLRNELHLDLKRQVEKRGGATALLVSGDIAFSGAAIEYVNARTFLTELCLDLGLPTEDVWVIPGNHDVDWTRHGDADTVVARQELMTAPDQRVDSVLDSLMQDQRKARALLAPLSNYLAFAADFGCQPASSELSWNAVFELGGGYILRIRGVNSALVSDRDDEDKLPQLVVGSVQTQLERMSGTVHATMCHHPSSWIRDGARLRSMFDANAKLQLMGHEHRFGIRQADPLKIAAGALHPERDKTDWEPRYNLITVEVLPNTVEGRAQVQICVASRVWDRDAARWTADPAAGPVGEVCFPVELDEVATIAVVPLNARAEQYEDPPPDRRVAWLANRRRRLEHRLAGLFKGEQEVLAQQLGMTLGEIAALEPGALAGIVIDRAEKQGDLADLWDAVERAQGVANPPRNPYREPQ